MKSFVYFMTFILLAAQVQAQSLTKTELALLAQKAISLDATLQQARTAFKIHFEHPKLIQHPNYQTLIYHETFRETLKSGLVREWDFVGGDVRFHYNVATQVSYLQKNIYPVSVDFSSAKLWPESLVQNRLQKLSLNPLSFKIRHRFWLREEKNIPVYWIEVRQSEIHGGPRTVVFDARTGQLLEHFSRRHYENLMPTIIVRDGSHNNARSKKLGEDDDLSTDENVLNQYKNNCQLISMKKDSLGTPLLINPTMCDLVYDGKDFKTKPDDSAKVAQFNSKSTLAFYGEKLNQWGLDFDPTLPAEKRTPVVSIVHIGFHFDNAYWDEDLKVMVYGDGSGGNKSDSTHDYTLALDVAGHEYTHALVSQTANFATADEPGAMNEAFADIFGILIDRSVHARATWSIGAKLYNNTDGDKDEIALRSLSNPAKYKTSKVNAAGETEQVPFPMKYSEKLAVGQTCNDDNDQCEVHANSTIFSHAAYLFDQSLQDQGFTSAEADLELAKIYFTTLTHKLHENETMKSAAIQLIETCGEISKTKTCEALSSALKQVELN